MISLCDRAFKDNTFYETPCITANKVFTFLFKYLQGWKSEQLSSWSNNFLDIFICRDKQQDNGWNVDWLQKY